MKKHVLIAIISVLVISCSSAPEYADEVQQFRQISNLLDQIFLDLDNTDVLAINGNRVAVYSDDDRYIQFMDYLAGKTSVHLTMAVDNVQLFEREQLSMLIEEQKLSLSGMTTAEGAKAIGNITSVDLILVPFVTKIGSSADISVKLVSTTTGEVVFASGYSLSLTEDMESLFHENKEEPTVGVLAGREEPGTDPQLLLYSIREDHSYYHQRIVSTFSGRKGLKVSGTRLLDAKAFVESAEYRGSGVMFALADEVIPSKIIELFFDMDRDEFEQAAQGVFYKDIIIDGHHLVVIAGPSRASMTDALIADEILNTLVFNLLVEIFSG